MAQRVYWVGLLLIVKKLCKYWLRYSAKMPSDLPAAVATAMPYITLACQALELYDLTNTPGQPDNSPIGGF